MERFAAEKYQKFAFGWLLGYMLLNLSISEIFLKFPNFLRSSVLNRSATQEVTRTLTFPFSLYFFKNALKLQK